MRSRVVAAAVLGGCALLRVLAACGSDEGGPASAGTDGGVLLGPDGAPIGTPGVPAHADPIPIEQLQQALIDAVCIPQEACCKAAGLEYVPGGCAALLSGADAGASAGVNIPFTTPAGSTYDPQAAGDCLSYYRLLITAHEELCKQPVATIAPGQTEDQFTLDQTLKLQAAAPGLNLVDPKLAETCGRIFVGTKPLGAECASVYECALPTEDRTFGGVFCSPSKLDGGQGPNICRYDLFVGEGAPCTGVSENDSRTCYGAITSTDANGIERQVKSLYCDPTTKTCKQTHDVDDGQPCNKDDGARCKPTSFCDDNGGSGLCKPLLATGVACTNSENCANGNCKDGHCADRVAPGAACEDRDECTTDNCSRVSNTCTPWPSNLARPQICSGKSN